MPRQETLIYHFTKANQGANGVPKRHNRRKDSENRDFVCIITCSTLSKNFTGVQILIITSYDRN